MADSWKIDRGLVDRLCSIAKLDLTEKERDRYAQQLAGVLDAFRMLDEVDTSDVEPSFQPTKIENIWREDAAAGEAWSPLDNTQHSEGHYFKGPKIV